MLRCERCCVLIVLDLIVMTLGVYGIVRFPDVYMQLHASSMAAFLGVPSLPYDVVDHGRDCGT
jgi:monovalent cation/proton antiporter MnhG/PhaG subunit